MGIIYSFEKKILLIKMMGKNEVLGEKTINCKKIVYEMFRKIDKNLRVRVGVISKYNSI